MLLTISFILAIIIIMNIIVKKGQERLSLERAIGLGVLKISGNSLSIVDDNYNLCQSTNLFDRAGREIFVDDVLVDIATGLHYKVILFYSTIYIQQIKNKSICVMETLSNFKLGNCVDFLVL